MVSAAPPPLEALGVEVLPPPPPAPSRPFLHLPAPSSSWWPQVSLGFWLHHSGSVSIFTWLLSLTRTLSVDVSPSPFL